MAWSHMHAIVNNALLKKMCDQVFFTDILNRQEDVSKWKLNVSTHNI